MGKGGMSQGGDEKGEGEVNMAAWLLGVNNLKIQPFILPPLGIHTSLSLSLFLSFFLFFFFFF